MKKTQQEFINELDGIFTDIQIECESGGNRQTIYDLADKAKQLITENDESNTTEDD